MRLITLSAIVISVILLLARSRMLKADMFTGMLHMQKALHAERSVSVELREYIAEERIRIEKLEKIANDFETHSQEALVDPESHLANPVNAYLLIKRFTVDWRQLVDKYLSASRTQEFLQNLYSKTLDYFPKDDDLFGSATALLRLQDTYELPTDKIASGDMTETKSRPMNADDCFQLGVIAYNKADWYHSILWMSKSLKLDEAEIIKTCRRADILDYLSFSTYKQGNIRHAYNLTLEWLEIEPEHVRAKNNLKNYEETILEESRQYQTNRSDEIRNVRIKTEYRNSDDFDVYEKLCRGEKTHDIDERHLTCQYLRHHPMFYINPLREEVLHLKPRIVVYHNVMNEDEIDKMKELSIPKLSRSGVFQLKESDNPYSDYRTSQSGWIADEEHPLIRKLSVRTMAMTNLTLDTVELFQVLNYGIGGQYEPHYDFARPTEVNTFDEWRGNRIATVIFYMSDVEAGGRTVFNAIGVGAVPERGSCIVWYNLLKNGEGDYDTRHAGCPVLAGSKWVVNKWFHVRGQEFTYPCSLLENE